MNEKELFKQKFQAQLDEWKADIAKLKAKASGAEADVQIAINKQVEAPGRSFRSLPGRAKKHGIPSRRERNPHGIP